MDIESTLSALSSPVRETLVHLYHETLRMDPTARLRATQLGISQEDSPSFYDAMRDAYMPVTPDFGLLIYQLVRLGRARHVVEYGTSFGISTLFLASALRDNGDGSLITTELYEHKARQAAESLRRAKLDAYVELRVGDALSTLAHDVPEQIDLLFLDGAKATYADVLALLEPRLSEHALIICDNTEMDSARAFIEHVQSPERNYVRSELHTTAIGITSGHLLITRA